VAIVMNYSLLIEPVGPNDEPAVSVRPQPDRRANDPIPGHLDRNEIDSLPR
jgi:hypothetical protein